MAGYVINEDGRIPNNLRADIMRCSMENKNLLQKKGSMYVGTGGYMDFDDSTVCSANTAAIDIPLGSETGYFLVTNSSATYGWEFKNLDTLISGATVAEANYASTANVANSANSLYIDNSGVSGISSGYKIAKVVSSLPVTFDDNTIYFVVGS